MIKKIIFKLKKIITNTSNETLTINYCKEQGMKVGENVWGLINCTIDTSACWLIEIGNNVVFAPQIYLLVHDTSTKKICGKTRIGKIKIGNDVFVGARSFIMPNVEIGDNSIIGANSVVTKNIPPNVVAAGNPAKVLCSLEEYKNKIMTDFENSPQYDSSYTIPGGITPEKKEQMKEDLKTQSGYVK